MTQTEYLLILFNDAGFSIAQRKAMIKADFGKESLDELTNGQRSVLISQLKNQKPSTPPTVYED